MKLIEYKKLLEKTGDLRFLEKEKDGRIQITDMFLNGDGLLRVEYYDSVVIPDVVEELEDLYSWLPLYTSYEEEEDTDSNSKVAGINNDLTDIDIDELIKSKVMDYSKTVLDFANSNKKKLLFRANHIIN